MLHAENTYFNNISEQFGPVPDFLLARTVLLLIYTRSFPNGSVFIL